MASNNLTRDSRFELLRIIAISCVFMHHTLIYLGLMNYTGTIASKNREVLGIFLNAFFIIGVDLFILISGYFGINFSLSRLAKILFYCLVCTLISCIGLNPEIIKIIISDIVHLHTINTFVPSYVGLFMLAPLLNKALQRTSYSELKKIIFLFTIVNVFMGFILGYSCISENGYNLINFIYLYCIGQFIRKMPPIKAQKLFIIYIIAYVSVVLWALLYKSNFSAFAYNSPFVLLLAISVFLAVAKIRIQSSLINKLASASFCMFLLEPWVREIFITANPKMYISQIILSTLGGYIILFISAYITTYFVDKIFKLISPHFVKIDEFFKFSK